MKKGGPGPGANLNRLFTNIHHKKQSKLSPSHGKSGGLKSNDFATPHSPFLDVAAAQPAYRNPTILHHLSLFFGCCTITTRYICILKLDSSNTRQVLSLYVSSDETCPFCPPFPQLCAERKGKRKGKGKGREGGTELVRHSTVSSV